ncbi:hypothetical protein PHYBLDRAFT_158403, partial [Phycomyces blakesleeanus NRRL 1555(-)]
MDAHDNFSDAVHQSYTNHITRLLSQTSPRGRSSPSRFDSIQDAPTEPLSVTSTTRTIKRNRFQKVEANEPYAPSPQRHQMQSALSIDQSDYQLEASQTQIQKTMSTNTETSNRLANTTGGSAKDVTMYSPRRRRFAGDYDDEDDRPRSKHKTANM